MFQGDSGGPLSYDHKGQHVLVGVTSYGLDGMEEDGTMVGCASVSPVAGQLLSCQMERETDDMMTESFEDN